MGQEQSNNGSTCLARSHSQSQPMSPLVRQMHIAVMQKDISRLMELISLGADVNYPWVNHIQPSIKDGSTALMEAISLNHGDIVHTLIQAGANLHTLDRDGLSPLHRASYHGREKICRILISAGADCVALDKDNNTPLHLCVKNGFVHNNTRCLVTLLDLGVPVTRPNKQQQIPLHFAATWGLADFSQIIISWCPGAIDTQDSNFLTPFNYCVMPIVEQRLRTPGSRTVSDCFRRYQPTIRIFLQNGCDHLGLVIWLNQYKTIILTPGDDPEFDTWYSENYPPSLKHLCRVFFQNRFGFNHLRDMVRYRYCKRKVNQLEIPPELKTYLCRKLIQHM